MIPKGQRCRVRVIDCSLKHLISQRYIRLSTHIGTECQRGPVGVLYSGSQHLSQHLVGTSTAIVFNLRRSHQRIAKGQRLPVRIIDRSRKYLINRRGPHPISKGQWGSVRIIYRSLKHLISQSGIRLSIRTRTKGQRGSIRIINRSRKHLVSPRGPRLSTHAGYIGTKGERGCVEPGTIIRQPRTIAVSRIVGATALNEPLNAANTPKMGHGPDCIPVDNHTTNILAVILVQPQTRRLTINITKVPIFDGGLLFFGHPGEVSTRRPGRNETGSSRIGQTVSTEL